LVTVMMWRPMASAWKMFSSSRGLPQISSMFGVARINSSAAVMIGTGSRAVSAIRPANTRCIDAPHASPARSRTDRASRRRRIDLDAAPREPANQVVLGCRLVFVTGIFITFSPHDAITRLPLHLGEVVAGTSNEIGRSGIAASVRANAA
jgi:hypothetical protein